MKRAASEIFYGAIVTLFVTAVTLVAVAMTLTDIAIDNIKQLTKIK
jgi:hypothetical protein